MINNCHTYTMLDIVEEVGYNPDSSILLKDIIIMYDENIADMIMNNKVAKIPYIGNIRKNLVRQEFNKIKQGINLNKLRKTIDKERYKHTVKNFYKNAITYATKIDRLKVVMKRNIAANRELYDRLNATAGKTYANCYMLSLALMEPIKETKQEEIKLNIHFKFKK